MKKLMIALFLCTTLNALSAQEYKIITTIESVVPGGLGRSRMIQTDANGGTEETKMNNFFSMVGINFDNVVDNDRMIAQMLSTMTKDGWKMISITPGVYAADKSTGIFITRYLFSKD